MAKQSSDRLSAHKAVTTKSTLRPMVRVTGQKAAGRMLARIVLTPLIGQCVWGPLSNVESVSEEVS